MYCDWPQFQRCCFCMPLRRGVLVIAYIKVLLSAFMVGMYSNAVHQSLKSELMYQAVSTELPAGLCIFVYCVECVFAAVLVYGTHKKWLRPVKIYYYFSLCTLLTTVLLQIVQMFSTNYFLHVIELGFFCFTGLCLQLYLLILVWSLVKKLEVEGPHVYENQLHQFVNGHAKVDPNGVYNPSTVPAEV